MSHKISNIESGTSCELFGSFGLIVQFVMGFLVFGSLIRIHLN